MSTPAGIGNGNASSHGPNTRSTFPAAPASAAPPLIDLGHSIFFKDYAKAALFLAWLSLPHPEIEISTYISELNAGQQGQTLYDATLALKVHVNETVTAKQEKRFALVAQKFDVSICLGKAMEIFDDVAETVRILIAWENGENRGIDPAPYSNERRGEM